MSQGEQTVPTPVIAGRNPVLELLRSGKTVECVYIQAGASKGVVGKIIAMAKEQGIPVKDVTAQKLQTLTGLESHQGVAALPAAWDYAAMEDIVAGTRGEPLFVVLCDGIEDPHNLGAVIRTAEAAGAHGGILPKRHSAGLTATVVKAAAGATAHLPVVRVPNLITAMDDLRKAHNMWFYCADMGSTPWCQTDYAGAVGLVVGGEGAGVGRLIKEHCDFVVSLPMLGQVGSLNASVAAGVILYEIARQRRGIPARQPGGQK